MKSKSVSRAVEGTEVGFRCPACRKIGMMFSIHGVVDAVFHQIASQDDSGRVTAVEAVQYGVRVCPNDECGEPAFVILKSGKIVATYPAEEIDFDPAGIPIRILRSFAEAVTCHAAGSFRACAIMVRRTLEEICEDRDAAGGNLKERIVALGGKIVVPKELIEAADELRILGNDAAHLEAKVYDEVGKEEVEAAIDLAKEILKAVYQLSNLVDRLRELKKS